MSKPEKKSIDEIRDELRQLQDQSGPLYIDPALKEPGYVYRTVDADRPGRVAKLQRIGYEVVEQKATDSKKDSVGGSRLGSSVTVELGRRTHRNGILMRISEERYSVIKELKRERAAQQREAVGDTGISTQFGHLTIGNEKKTF